MVYTTWQVDRYAKDPDVSGLWSSTVTSTFTKFYQPYVRTNLGEGKDVFGIKITNFNNSLDNYWQIGDRALVYYKVNSTTIASSDLVLTGIVTNLPDEVSGTQNIIRVEGNNYSESLMSALVFIDPTASGLPLNQMIERALVSTQNFNPNFKVTWSSTNPTTTSEGEAFPMIYERWFYKSMLSFLEKHCSASYTKDGNYYWYVNNNNEFIWRRASDAVDHSFNTSTDEYKKLVIKKDLSKVVNFVIAKGGLDPKGGAISTRYDDPVSRAKHGFKYSMLISNANTGRSLMDLDQAKHGSNSNFPGSYPFTTVWDKQDGTGKVTVSNDSDYVTAVRDEVKYRLLREAQAYVETRSSGKLMIEVTFDNGKGWVLGGIVRVTIPKIGKTNQPMRVREVYLTENSEVYTLEEDVGTI